MHPARRRKYRRWVLLGLLVLGLIWLNGPGLRWIAPRVVAHFLEKAGLRGEFKVEGNLTGGLSISALRIDGDQELASLTIDRLNPYSGIGLRDFVMRLPASGGPSLETQVQVDDAVFAVTSTPGFTGPSAAALPKIDFPKNQASSLPEPFRNWGLNLTAITAEPFLIRGNLATGQVTGSLKIGGTLATPAPNGVLEVRDFAAALPFSTLNVRAGTATFTPATGFDPILEIHGSAEPRPYRVSVYVPANSARRWCGNPRADHRHEGKKRGPGAQPNERSSHGGRIIRGLRFTR